MVHCNKNLQNSRRITERETPEGLEPCRNRKTETECETIKLKQQCNDLPGGEQCELTCGRCGKSVLSVSQFSFTYSSLRQIIDEVHLKIRNLKNSRQVISSCQKH